MGVPPSLHLIDFYSPESTPILPSETNSLSTHEHHILQIVHARWPTSSLEIAEFLGHETVTREEKKVLSSRIAYHVKKLVQKKKLISKRFGNALIVWPFEVEVLRLSASKNFHTKKEKGH